MSLDRTLSIADADPARPSGEYQPGVCNIGPREIARRRRAGHVGAIATLALLAALIAFDAPPVLRLLALVPAAVSASGYLQARLRFCAAFGWAGIVNFGGADDAMPVHERKARAADRRMALTIGLASFLVGLVVALGALLLPV